MRLNLGSGKVPLEGFVNVDAHNQDADVVGDIRELEFEGVEQVVMYHLLEHLPHAETVPVLRRIRGWMVPRARIVVEVPDMEALMGNPRATWLTDVYGVQDGEGEFHYAGFNHYSLRHALIEAGFCDVRSTCFISTHMNRPGLPCIEATGYA